MITEGEYYFFEKIKDDCNIIFDVGVRDDIHYLNLIKGKEFHLFEPNTQFYERLLSNIKNNTTSSDNKVITNNFGLGNESGDFMYYHNTQSFTKLITHVHSDVNNISTFKIVSLGDYILDKGISNIDFIKIDTEGHELDVLYANINFVKENVKYIQFEYSSAWLSKDNIFIKDVFNDLSDIFEFYILKDLNHPHTQNSVEKMIKIDRTMFNTIDSHIKNGCGYNIGLIKKNSLIEYLNYN